MSDKSLQDKVEYFKEQELLDISDDERDFPDEGFRNAERALADFEAMPPPAPPAKLVRQPNSFLGPTPKEVQNESGTYATKKLAPMRADGPGLTRSATAPESEMTKSFPVTKPRQGPSSNPPKSETKLEETTSMPDLVAEGNVPFYKKMGVAPRELKNGKYVKTADNIKLDPEEKQLLKGEIFYFFPNDDVSMARRRRIHKAIQLGAAWVKEWCDDVKYVMVDDGSHTYSQLLRNVNKAGFSRRVIIVKFDPYIPQCIELGFLLDHTAGRFALKGAPQPNPPSSTDPPLALPDSQVSSLPIKPSRRQLVAEPSRKTDSVPTEGFISQPADEHPTISDDEVVKDSFIRFSSPAREEQAKQSDLFNDTLSEAIQQTKAVAHLPLDEDEEIDFWPSSSGSYDLDSGTDDEDQEPSPKRAKTSRHTYTAPKPKGGINQNAFQCMDPVGKSSSQNPNARAIEILDQMCKHYDQMNDQWRTLAYRKAITTLQKQTTKISTAKEAAALPFIGSRFADKIEEIVFTDRLRRLDGTRDDPMDKVLRLFLGVYGAGLSRANKWIQAGHRTLDNLVANAKLTESEKIGIEHYYDFAARIPRAEVEAHGNFVTSALNKLDPEFQAIIMGSYRRGAKDSGDIDLIITKPGASVSMLREIVFQKLVPSLFKVGFLKVKLATFSRHEDGTMWHGASCLPSSKTWRRLDLLLVPGEEMGAALIYFTGNDIFNRSIRLLASKKGMRLNQRGLFKDAIRGKNREKLNKDTLVEGKDEKKIFEILGVPWREPTERIC
ncbi:hypothetical protein K458DRAFT_438871 [Lentithecium fluviatile CBS 122367]|uniref:DNA-directed DNA polymerase n=1 Tax=Lentithecium fluviatile CBS 122367 TaxID=1168545 RepID=A0A6G1JLV6_9PLEO|nr:hypothetical protein K458DRAFT_438871 [Lentithecium fluviatile CBS 122367]